MLQTQQIDLNQEEFDKIFEFYEEHEEHYVRQRAHILLLRHKGYTVSTIAEALWLEKNYIALYIKAWYHFGLNGFLSNETDKLYNQIKEIETPEPVETKPLINWSKIYSFIKIAFQKIYSFFERIALAIFTFFLTISIKLFTKIKAIDYKKFYIPFNQNLSNKLNIGRDSNNNIVFQMINVFSENKEPEYENKIASSLEDTKKQFLEIFTKQKDYITNSQMVAIFLALNDKVQQIKDKEKRKRLLAILTTFAAMYIYYHTIIKGGLVIFTVFSMSITIFNFSTWIDKETNIEHKNSNIATVDSIQQLKEREQFISDSIQQQLMLQQKADSLAKAQEISDSLAQLQIIEEDDDCYFLAKKNNYVTKLIKEDNKNHEAENYFVKFHDYNDKYFLVLKNFSDIKEAAFQRKQLVDNGFRNSKIIELKDNKYALSVHEFTSSKYDDVLSELYDWEQLCDSKKYKLTIYHNGVCKTF